MRMTMEKCDIMGCSQTGGSAVYDAISALKQISSEPRLASIDQANLMAAFKSFGQKTDFPYADVGAVQFQANRSAAQANEYSKGR